MTLSKRGRITANLSVGACLLTFLLTACAGVGFVGPTVLPITTTGQSVAVGVNVAGLPKDLVSVSQFAQLTGYAPKLVMWYDTWVDAKGNPVPFSDAGLAAVSDQGKAAMISWAPWNPSKGVDQPDFSLKSIADGSHDAYLRSWADAAAAWNRPFFLRFAYEMNGDWTSWSPGVNGNTDAQFVEAWRHVVNVFRSQGADNAIWVWSPNVKGPAMTTTFASVYPGDGYVDWVALDGYNWGTVSGNQWQSFSGLFESSYKAVTELTSKPLMIAETASSELGGDKAEWILNAFQKVIPSEMPRVRAVIWFDRDKETDWRVNSSDSSLAAFRTAVASATYH